MIDLIVLQRSGEEDEEGSSSLPSAKKLKMEHDKKKEKRQIKVDEDEIQKMQ